MRGAVGVKRVKSGCVTCRIRRVKCDEGKPECRRCVTTGRICDGYSTLPFSRRDLQAASRSTTRPRDQQSAPEQQVTGLLPRLVADPAFSDLLEKRYFQFFRQRTVASTNSIVDCRFWDRVVLQACHTEPAIKHAVLALSSLHQLNNIPTNSDAACQHRLYAEKQRHKALAEAQRLIASANPEDVDRVLITCIMFIIFESVRGDYIAAAMHMDSGRAIVAQNSQRMRYGSRRRVQVEIQHALARLDLPAICFSDSSSPYRYDLGDFHRTDPILSVDKFHDLNEAQASLVDLARWLLLICNASDDANRSGNWPAVVKHQAEKVKCCRLIQKWHRHFEDAVAKDDPQGESAMVLNLRIWHSCSHIMSSIDNFGPETRYDTEMPHFRAGIEYAETLAAKVAEPDNGRSFSFDMGYSIPLWYISTRCRDPTLRRRAIALLLTHPRQEGVWETVSSGVIAQRWMHVEESGLAEVRCAADIPEHCRIRRIDAAIDVDRSAGALKLTYADAADAAPVEMFADWKQATRGAKPYTLASDDYMHVCKTDEKLPTFDVRREHVPQAGVGLREFLEGNSGSSSKTSDQGSPEVKMESPWIPA